MQTIALYNLSVGYGQHCVLSGLTASLDSGQLTCLVGANGVGKSTLLRTLAGFQQPLAGNLCIEGVSATKLTRQQWAQKMGVVLTEKPDIRNVTVAELIGLGRSPYTNFWGTLSAEDHRIVNASMQLTGIEQLAQRNVHNLSDGERQKVMIAKALAQQTPIILLDEPTAFLDFQSKVQTLQLLARLAHTYHKTIFLSIHDIELAIQLADRLWLIDQTRKLHTGTTVELTESGVLSGFVEQGDVFFDAKQKTIKIRHR